MVSLEAPWDGAVRVLLGVSALLLPGDHARPPRPLQSRRPWCVGLECTYPGGHAGPGALRRRNPAVLRPGRSEQVAATAMAPPALHVTGEGASKHGPDRARPDVGFQTNQQPRGKTGELRGVTGSFEGNVSAPHCLRASARPRAASRCKQRDRRARGRARERLGPGQPKGLV